MTISRMNVQIDGIPIDPCVELSAAYLRIRCLVEAWDTEHGGANRFEVTERCIKDLIKERDALKNEVYHLKDRLKAIKDMANVREY